MDTNSGYDVKTFLNIFMPSLLELLGDQKISWSLINRQLKSHLDKIKEEHSLTGEVIEREATFYSVIIEKIAGGNRSDAMLDFYNQLFKELNKKLSVETKKPIHKIISQLLSNTSKDYLNFIGELATINFYLNTGNFELLNIEELITSHNKVSADFLLRTKDKKEEILVEVLNIHLENKIFNSFFDVERHLSSKINRKIDDKLIRHINRPIFIQPVLWFKTLEEIKYVTQFYMETGFCIEQVAPPLVYMSFQDNNGNFEHKFNVINSYRHD